MKNFDPDKVLKTLADFGISPRGDATGPVGPLKSYVSMRMENRGGAPGGTSTRHLPGAAGFGNVAK